MADRLVNKNPLLYTPDPSDTRRIQADLDPSLVDPLDAEEIFDIIKHIRDPEYPHTLEQLGVVRKADISVTGKTVNVDFTPTIPKCTLASVIGLSIKVKLMRSLSIGYRIKVRIAPNTHDDEENLNKQIDDKERVCAALESENVRKMINRSIAGTDDIDIYLPFLR